MVHRDITKSNGIQLSKEKLTINIRNKTLTGSEVYQAMVSQGKNRKSVAEDSHRHIEQNIYRREHSDIGKGNGWMTYKNRSFSVSFFWCCQLPSYKSNFSPH